jgi:hypothetical protein
LHESVLQVGLSVITLRKVGGLRHWAVITFFKLEEGKKWSVLIAPEMEEKMFPRLQQAAIE